MSTLATLLRYLERDDISEVCLQSDTVVAAARGTDYVPLSKVPLSTAQIEGLLQGTAVLTVLQAQGPTFSGQIAVDVEARRYAVHVQRHEGRVQVRFLRGAAPAPAPGVAGPPPPPARAGAPPAAAARPPAAPPRAATPVAAPPVAVAAAAPAPAAFGPAGATGAVGPVGAVGPADAATAPLNGDMQLRRVVDLQDPAFCFLVEALLRAKKQRASDVHVGAGAPLRVRRFGELCPLGEPLAAAWVERVLSGLLTPSQGRLLQAQGYVDFSLELPEAGRLRVNIGRQAAGLKGCFRLLLDAIPSLQALGLPPDIGRVSHYHQGLVVISGPNNQGKTTTMAAIVDLINETTAHHIITVEDPVEFLHPVKKAVVSQREVGVHTRSFARALKASLREDPDVIVIGELRDRETVEIALTAAETGHLVLATMSTRSAAKTIDRLIDLFPPDLQSQVRATLAGALKAVISQRLVPRAGGEGMVAAVELMTGSVPLWNLIRENKLVQLPTLQQRGRGLGMIRFDTSLQELCAQKLIDEEVARRFADNPVELERSLRGDSAPAAAPPAGARAKLREKG